MQTDTYAYVFVFVLKEGYTGEMINYTIELSALERKKFILKINIYYIK